MRAGALEQALYLLDPGPTVWAGILSADHLAWCEVQDLEVLTLAARQAAAIPGAAGVGAAAAEHPAGCTGSGLRGGPFCC